MQRELISSRGEAFYLLAGTACPGKGGDVAARELIDERLRFARARKGPDEQPARRAHRRSEGGAAAELLRRHAAKPGELARQRGAVDAAGDLHPMAARMGRLGRLPRL